MPEEENSIKEGLNEFLGSRGGKAVKGGQEGAGKLTKLLGLSL